MTRGDLSSTKRQQATRPAEGKVTHEPGGLVRGPTWRSHLHEEKRT
jgi:hypothetical protein